MIWQILCGLVVGMIAQAIGSEPPKYGWIVTALVGMAGGWLGGIFAAMLHLGLIGGFLLSIACSMGLFSLIRRKRFV